MVARAPLEYRVSIPKPHTHRVVVELTARGLARGPAVFRLPAWSPGSYKIRDYARNVIRLEARDARGRPLAARKRDKQTWEVDRRGSAVVHLVYEVYCNEKTVRTCHVDDRHAFLQGPALFLYLDGQKDRAVRLRVDLPRGWHISTGLDPVPGTANAFRAPGYDDFVDCPLEIGTHKVIEFAQGGRPHRFAIYGKGNGDGRKIVADTRRLVAQAAKIFGGPLPYRHYTFLLALYGAGAGGLEHKNSTALITTRGAFQPRSRYLGFLGLVAHEFFHTWNVKRIRPEPLGPFDYEREVYTRALWVLEGFTSYFDHLIVRRAGLMTRAEYLGKLGEQIQRFRETPGRSVQDLESSSFDAWIKHYQPDENTPNATVSYYEKGSLVALLLDLEIRRRSGGRRRLDDLMRLLWRRYGVHDRAFAEREIQGLAEEVAGGPLAGFFADFVRGTVELPFEEAFAPVGVELAYDGPPDTQEATLGVRLAGRSGPAIVGAVLADGPAYRDGLNARDEIVAWNGARIDSGSLSERLSQGRPGDRVRLTVFRDDELRSLRVALGAKPAGALRVRECREPSPEQKAALEAWLGS